MQIRSVNIYKTPLDNSYSNVVDFINVEQNKKETLLQVFDTSYSHRQFNGLGRSIKRVGNSTLIVLPISYEDGRDYNYMIIEDDNQRLFFYFITNIISENDSTTNPSATFTLEWDAWNNNIENFKDVNNIIERKHYNRFSIEYGSYGDVVGLSPIYRNTNINLELNTYFKDIHYGERYIPAFYVITFKEMLTFPVPNTIKELDNGLSFGLPVSIITTSGLDTSIVTEDITICDSVNNKYNRKVIYQLAGIFDTVNEEFVNGYVEGKNLEFYVNGTPYRYNPDYASVTYGLVNQPRLAIDDKKTPYISNITLSFHSPFNYTYDEVSRTLTFVDNPVVLDIGYSSNLSNTDYIPYIIIGDMYVKRGDDKMLRYYSDRMSPTVTLNRNTILEYSDILRNPQSFLNIDNDLIDPISYTPPFNSVLLAFNSKYKNIFTPWYNDAFTFKVNLKTPQPQLEVFYNTEKTLIADRFFIENSGFFSFGVDSLQNYMAKNGVQTKMKIVADGMKLVGGIIQTIAGAKTGNVSMASSGLNKSKESALGLLKTNAQLMDSYRTPDEWVSNSGECDMIYQDRVRLIKEYVDRNNLVYREFMKSVYNEGYDFTSIASPFDNSRIIFDYVKTVNCDLSPITINDGDRKIIESALNRGVTKWHIFSNGSTIKFDNDMIKKPEIKNLEIFTELNSDVKNWLYGT